MNDNYDGPQMAQLILRLRDKIKELEKDRDALREELKKSFVRETKYFPPIIMKEKH